ncbi:MAG: phospho-sugar mutase [Halobacteriovoraceae bacterium]|nr:phospho-sugar mutase [Halobacteriovoraceae bacterium]MCB9095612.1 phospho-sugar mutase [Halobacteriovoraceae bacterium]
MLDYEEIRRKAMSWSEQVGLANGDQKKLEKLISDSSQSEELVNAFYRDLEFGTAGLRSLVGLGSNRMNIYNVRKAAWALGSAVKEVFSDKDRWSVAIAYDSRLTSESFARETAGVLAAQGIDCYLAPKPTATPILSYAVRQKKCCAGVMITASHNPKDYNGFKAYWADGAQVTPPVDQLIISYYYKSEGAERELQIDFEQALKSGAVKFFEEDFYTSYIEDIKKNCFRTDLISERGGEVGIVYTALHGTGGEVCQRIARELGFNQFYPVKEQIAPDGNFPTAEYPNPEDPKSLKLAVDLMKEKKADVAFGSDPDTDRLGVVVSIEGEPHFLTGNQIASVLLYYKLTTMQQQGLLKDNALVLKTIVTTPLHERICEYFGVEIVNTLTGFKWMGKVLTDREKENKSFQFIFASEEAFGSLTHDKVRDKDGISAIALFSEAVLYYKLQGMNVLDVLGEMYEKFGFHADGLLNVQYPGASGEQKIKKIMNALRERDPSELLGEKLKEKEDFMQTKYASNVLGFHFESGNSLYVRPSGTEPKIKFYCQVRENGELEVAKKRASEKITEWKKCLEEYCHHV